MTQLNTEAIMRPNIRKEAWDVMRKPQKDPGRSRRSEVLPRVCLKFLSKKGE